MIIKADRKYLSELKKRYKKANKSQKKVILDEFTKTLGYDRQYTGKLLRGRYQYVKGVIIIPINLYQRSKGDFAWTLNFTDVKIQWTKQVAVFKKAQVRVFAGIRRIRARLHFPLLGLDSDSGGEFINNQLYRCRIQEKITFTKGKPGKKYEVKEKD